MTFNVAVIAGLSFLGFGLQPPAADWGLMINENRIGLTISPGRSSCPWSRSRSSRSGRASSATASPAPRSASSAADGRRMTVESPVLEVDDLRVEIEVSAGVDIVDEVSFQIAAGEVLGLVGESGVGEDDRRPRAARVTRGGARGSPAARSASRAATSSTLPQRASRAARQARLLRPAGSGAALNPAIRIGAARGDALGARLRLLGRGAARAIAETLDEVLLPSDERSSSATRTSSRAASSSASRSRWLSRTARA